MHQRLVECIPNFSEGRQPAVVDAIVESISEVAGIILLDRSSDVYHNRSVITFVGHPESMGHAAFAAIATAAELIDMEQHQGEHPRMGATDVVPFVPLAGASMDDCIQVARALGQRVGEQLNIPVYLYEHAATRGDRENLAHVRRGGYEVIRDAIHWNSKRAPDFGPKELGSAGAIAIGARSALIAINVYLTTDEVSIAKKVAASIRESSGGLPFVKALGFLVSGRAQVSMNLTDYTRTPVTDVMKKIRSESARYGVTIYSSEVVGLIPQDAIVNASQWCLESKHIEARQILEDRLLGSGIL